MSKLQGIIIQCTKFIIQCLEAELENTAAQLFNFNKDQQGCYRIGCIGICTHSLRSSNVFYNLNFFPVSIIQSAMPFSKAIIIKNLIAQALIMTFFLPSMIDCYVASPLIRAGTLSMNAIANLSGYQAANFSVTFSQALPTVTTSINNSNMLVYGFKTFKTYDNLYSQEIKINRVSTFMTLNLGFTLQAIQNNNFTNIMKLQIYYMAFDQSLGSYIVAYDQNNCDFAAYSHASDYSIFNIPTIISNNNLTSFANILGIITAQGRQFTRYLNSTFRSNWSSHWYDQHYPWYGTYRTIVNLHSFGISSGLTTPTTNLAAAMVADSLTILSFTHKQQQYIYNGFRNSLSIPYLRLQFRSKMSIKFLQYSYLVVHLNLTNSSKNPFRLQLSVQQIIINNGVGTYISVSPIFFENMYTALGQFGALKTFCRLDYQFQIINNSTFSGLFFRPSTTLGTNTACALNLLNQTLWIFRTVQCQNPYIYYNPATYDCQASCGPYTFFNVSALTCPACHYSCFACSAPNISTNCTSCAASDNRTLINSTCRCLSGFFDNMFSRQCIQCTSVDTNCSTCTVNLTSFNTTQITAFFSNSTWRINILPFFTCTQCNLSFFYDSITRLCSTCSIANCSICQSLTTCQTCTNGTLLSSTGFCFLCSGVSNCMQCNATNICQLCNTGYSLINGTCVNCNYSCNTCNSQTSCTSCNSTQFRILNSTTSQCQCNSGYFDNAYSGQCVACTSVDSRCLACSANLSSFTQPQLTTFFANSNWPTNILSYFSCSQCQAPSFYNSSAKLCHNCSVSNCSLCLNTTSCETCNSGYVLSSNGSCYVCSGVSNCLQCSSTNICQNCIIGYATINGTCAVCNYSCYTCTQTTSCSTCLSSQFRTLNSSTTQCQCNTGYFDNYYSGQCVACASVDSKCQACSANLGSFTSTQLITFFSNPSWPANILTYFSCSQCQAPSFYNSSAKSCYNCSVSNCSLCLTTTSCQTCSLGFTPSSNGSCFLCQGVGNCIQCNATNYCQNCKISNFLVNGTCIACNYSCHTCTSTTSCASCSPLHFRTFNSLTLQCQCDTGYFDNLSSGECILCTSVNMKCLECSVNLSSFTSPHLIAFFTNSSWPSNILAYFSCNQCQPPAFYNSLNRLCQSNCSIANCSSCQSANSCLICIAGFVVSSNGQCYVCSGSSNCVQCNFTNTCQKCIDGYISVNGNCVACNYSCHTCTQTTSCSSCLSSQFRTLNTSTSQCQCNTGYFDNYYSGQCIACTSVDSRCLKCSANLASFTSPQLAAFFANSAWSTNILTYFSCSQCQAPSFYNSTSKLCYNCSVSNCSLCLTTTQCQTCSSGLVKSSNGSCYVCSGVSNCMQCNGTNYCQLCTSGYAATNGVCNACNYTCYTCTQTMSCSSCLSSTFRTLNSSSNRCQCNTGYFDNYYSGQCVACASVDSKCQACSANLGSFTSTQLITFFSNSSWPTNILAYFSCSQCQAPSFYNSSAKLCYNCSVSNCSLCLTTTSCQTCSSGFALSSNRSCYVCSGANNCFQCNSTNYCQICTVGYAAINGNCMACDYSCYSCIQTTSCSSCLSSQFRTLNTTTSSCQCNIGYFDNTYSGQCLSCLSIDPNCSKCTVSLSSFTQQQLVTFFTNSSWQANILAYFSCNQCQGNSLYNPSTHLCQSCTIANCSFCLTLTSCKICSAGVLSTNGGCFVCSGASNCLQCNATNICQVCNSGYSILNGTCIGCNVTCTCNGYYLPKIDNHTCTTTCGDGIVAGLQQCDHGSDNALYGCSQICLSLTSINSRVQTQPLDLNSVSYGSYAIYMFGFCFQGIQFLGHVQTYQVLTMNNSLDDLKMSLSIHGFNQIGQYFNEDSTLTLNFNFMYFATATTALIGLILKLLSVFCRSSRKIDLQKKTSFQNKVQDQNNTENTQGTADFTVHYQKNTKKIVPLSNSSSVYIQPPNNFAKASNFVIRYPLFYLSVNSLIIYTYSLFQNLVDINKVNGKITLFYIVMSTFPFLLFISVYRHIKLDNRDQQNSYFKKGKCTKFWIASIVQRVAICCLTVGVKQYDLAIVLVLKAAFLIYFQHLKAFKSDMQYYRNSFMQFMHFILLSLLGFNRYYLANNTQNILPKYTIAYLQLGVILLMLLVNVLFILKKIIRKGGEVDQEQLMKLKQQSGTLTHHMGNVQQIDQNDINFRQNSGFNLSKHLNNYHSQKSKPQIGSNYKFQLKSNRTNQLQQNYFQSNPNTNRTNFNRNDQQNQHDQNQNYANKQSLATQKNIKSHRIIKKDRNQANKNNHIRFQKDYQNEPDQRQTVVNFKSHKQMAKIHYDKQRQKQSQLSIRQGNREQESDFDYDVDLVSINYEHEGVQNRNSIETERQKQRYSKSQKQNFIRINLQHQRRRKLRQAERQKRQKMNNRDQEQNQDNENDHNENIYKQYKRRMNKKDKRDY